MDEILNWYSLILSLTYLCRWVTRVKMLRTILHTSEFQQHTQQDVNNLDESLTELTSRTVSSVCRYVCEWERCDGEAQSFSVVPNSSSAGNGNDGTVCPSQTHFSVESCYHCCYVATAAVFFDAAMPRPRHPEIKWNIRSLIISKKHHNLNKPFWASPISMHG